LLGLCGGGLGCLGEFGAALVLEGGLVLWALPRGGMGLVLVWVGLGFGCAFSGGWLRGCGVNTTNGGGVGCLGGWWCFFWGSWWGEWVVCWFFSCCFFFFFLCFLFFFFFFFFFLLGSLGVISSSVVLSS